MKNNWVKTETPPDNDREVLVYVRDLKTPHWSGNHIGAYISGKWYLRGGTQDHYEYIRWLDISAEEELKTSEEWNKIYNKIIVVDPDGWDRKNFQSSWFEELISERTFTSRLLNSTISKYN